MSRTGTCPRKIIRTARKTSWSLNTSMGPLPSRGSLLAFPEGGLEVGTPLFSLLQCSICCYRFSFGGEGGWICVNGRRESSSKLGRTLQARWGSGAPLRRAAPRGDRFLPPTGTTLAMEGLSPLALRESSRGLPPVSTPLLDSTASPPQVK